MCKRLAWLAIAAVVSLSLGSCGGNGGTGMQRIRRTGVLRWGGDIQGGEPYVYEDPDHGGRLIGFEVDLANSVARELGVRAEFVQNDWESLVPSLERGTFDIVMNGLEVTPRRASQVRFTRPYYIFAARLTVRRGTRGLTTMAALRGRRVSALTNSLAADMLQQAGANVQLNPGIDEQYVVLENDGVDAVLLDDIIAQRYVPRHPRLESVADLGEGYYAIGARNNEPDVQRAVDDALGRIARSGELRRILGRWSLDNVRQDRLDTWTDDDTRRLLSIASRARFGMRHFMLFLHGAGITLVISFLAMALAIPFGILLALLRLYAPKPLGWLSSAYIEIFRGTPVLLQLYVIYYALAPILKLDALTAAVLGLGMNYAAYEAEVYRAGIQAVPKGQMEAAISLGMSTSLALRRVIMPQAFRLALPSVTNDFIALLKDSSLVSVITVVELTKRMQITAVDVGGYLIPGLLCAVLYFAMSYPLSIIAKRLEQRLARS